jgi:hypothetical protein
MKKSWAMCARLAEKTERAIKTAFAKKRTVYATTEPQYAALARK